MLLRKDIKILRDVYLQEEHIKNLYSIFYYITESTCEGKSRLELNSAEHPLIFESLKYTEPKLSNCFYEIKEEGNDKILSIDWSKSDLFPDVMQARTEIAKKNVEYIFLRIMRVLLEQDELYFKFNEFFGSTDEREESILSIMVSFLKETGFTVHIGDFLKDDGFKVTWEEEEEDVT